jgi:hypothetical protein
VYDTKDACGSVYKDTVFEMVRSELLVSSDVSSNTRKYICITKN